MQARKQNRSSTQPEINLGECFYCGLINLVRLDRYKKLICAECNEDIYGRGKK